MWLGVFAKSLPTSVPASGLGTTTAHRWTLGHHIYSSESSPSWMSKKDNEFMPKPWSEGAGLGMGKHHGGHPEDHLDDHSRHLGETHGWKPRLCQTSGTTQDIGQEERRDSEPKIVERPQLLATRVEHLGRCAAQAAQESGVHHVHSSAKRMTGRLSTEGDRKYRRIPKNRTAFLKNARITQIVESTRGVTMTGGPGPGR